jgi:ribosomal protein RSM22 (predicted rRNA methylase)
MARSRLRRLAKEADLAWEDEKFSYLAVSRVPGVLPAARIIARPRSRGGRIALKHCRADVTRVEILVTRREGAYFKAARRLDRGDEFQEEEGDPSPRHFIT